MSRCSYLLPALALLALPLYAQFGSGIQGTILDNSSAVIPGVRVVVTNIDTGVTREAVSSATGVYRVLGLGAGTYSVRASKDGFNAAEQGSVVVAANEIQKVDFTLSVGNITETVSVTAQVPALETEQGRISSQLDTTQLKELPIPNRNLFNLMALMPGMSGRNLSNEQLGSDATPQYNANGMRADGNSITVDDSSVNSISRGGRAEVTPNVETVAEVRVTTNNFSAEQGRNMGAQVSIITKSGSNEFHGSLWEYHGNNKLRARNFFDTTLPASRRNQFGYGVGGPIIRNKTFFYTTYEGVRRSGTSSSTDTVVTPELRNWVLANRPNSIAAYILGNFRPVADPAINVRDVGSPLPGANNFSKTPDGIPDIGTVRYLTTTDARSYQFTARVDHELRPGKDRLYVYFYRLHARSITPGIYPDLLRFNPTTGTFGNIVYTRTISPTAFNEFRAAVTRFMGNYCVPADPKHPLGKQSCNDIMNKQVPGISITGGGFARDVNVYPGGWFPTEYQLKDTFSMIRGGHAFKLGGEIRRAYNILWHTASYIPVYSFASILDFIDDEPVQMTRTVDPRTGLPTTTRADMAIWEGAAFIQDDWKVRPNLALNLGLRYDYYGPYTDTSNRFRNLVLGQGSTFQERLANGKVDVTPRGWSTDTLNFAPRFGFAWDIGGNAKNVVRGGYGIAYDRMATVQTATYRTNPPLAASANLGLSYGTTFTYSLGDPSKPYLGYPVDPSLKLGLDSHNGISGVRVGIMALDPHFNNPYAHNWFLGVQRQLPGRVVAEVSWVGSAGHHLVTIYNVNRFAGDMLPTPAEAAAGKKVGTFTGHNSSFSSINWGQTSSNSIYHGGTLAVRRQFAAGVSFQANYTFGKVLTESESEQGTTAFQDANNRALDRSVASFDVHQRVSFSSVWEIPFLHNCPSLVCKIVGGWQLSGYGVLEQGLPMNVTIGGTYPNGDYNADNNSGDRPNAPAGSIKRSGFTQQEFLNGIFAVSDFPAPAGGQNGNLGRNAFRGPGFARVYLALAKNFNLTERINTSLRLEAFNSLNRVNLNAPSTSLNSNTFGKVTSAQDPRVVLISLRLRF
jgi:hypothetical protein